MNRFKMMCVGLFLTLFALYSISMGSEYQNIENVQFLGNHDGDTITVNITGYPDIIGKRITIRVLGIDTPEINGKCDEEKILAHKAQTFVYGVLTEAKKIDIINVDRDKYFRIVGDVVYDGTSLTQVLLAKGYGYPYDGGTKQAPWCKK